MKKIVAVFSICLYQFCSHAQDKLVIENLVLEGAGIRGIAYCGALLELQKNHLLDSVKNVGGTSSGAITACLYSIGYTPEEMAAVIGNTNFGSFNDGKFGALGGMWRLNKKMGWYRGQKFLQWLEHLIAQKTGSPNTTFAQLKQMAKTDGKFKSLVVAATSLNHQCSIYFSADTYPEMRLADAVRASMAVPLYFEPVVIDSEGSVVPFEKMTNAHHLCVDGGFTANFIIQYFDDAAPAKTIGLRIDSDEQIAEDSAGRNLAYQPIRTTGDFVKAFYYITKENLNRANLTEADWRRTVSISDCSIGPKVKKLGDEQKQRLIDSGRQGVKIYLNGSKPIPVKP